MIGSLRGVVAERGAGEAIVEVVGVGYRLSVPTGTEVALVPGEEVLLHVHTHVREDAIVLFGFVTRHERDCFEALIGAHGVGPSLALAILSVHGPESLSRAVAEEDLDALLLVPGVGRKTAARLLVELQSRLDRGEAVPASGPPAASGAAASGQGEAAPAAVHADVRAALGSLGYGPDEVRRVVRALPPDGATEELLRVALHQLAATG